MCWPELASVFRAELAALTSAVAPWAQDETPPNLLSERQGTTRQEMRAIYGPERYERLSAIKKRYDPGNIFRVNHNITPA